MSISTIGQSLKESATLRLNEIASVLKAKGEAVIHLGGGEPKAKAPLDALTAAAAMLNTGEIRYTPADGLPIMKQAVIRYTEEFYNRKVLSDNVLISAGGKQALMMAFIAILNPQDEVLYPAPYWVSYSEMVRLCHGVPVPVLAEDGSFEPNIRDFEKNITSYTKAIIINSPNNPSGVHYSKQLIRDIVELCEKRGIYLLMDDLYHRLLFDGLKPHNPYDYSTDFTDNSKLIILNGVSKMYAMTGFRIGWAVGNTKVIKAMRDIQGHMNSCPAALLQVAAAAAINGVQTGVETLRMTLENNRNVMINQLKTFNGVRVTKPNGTYYCFADFSAYEKDSRKLSEFLLEKVRVVTVPGIEFGMDGYLRLSYCGGIKEMLEGLDRIKWALDPTSPNELFIGERKLVRDWV